MFDRVLNTPMDAMLIYLHFRLLHACTVHSLVPTPLQKRNMYFGLCQKQFDSHIFWWRKQHSNFLVLHYLQVEILNPVKLAKFPWFDLLKLLYRFYISHCRKSLQIRSLLQWKPSNPFSTEKTEKVDFRDCNNSKKFKPLELENHGCKVYRLGYH